jgi:FixJ family two-component response regulator
MVAIIVVITIIVFIIVDIVLRVSMKRMEVKKQKKEREEALDIGLKLDYSHEAKTLKRVEIKNPKAKILAVDDEEIILDSFRKILVLAGYCVDTVEKGKEALWLIQNHDYDFVFTDLKMPEMDGVDVTKAVKHLRPDIDVIVITGYASIETAVETMKFGAMDYVEKPFTEDELVAFVNKALIKRQDKIEKQMKPTVRLVTATTKESTSKHEFNVPAGIFVAPQHTWVNIEMNGTVRIGLDDFIRKIIGRIEKVVLPVVDTKIAKGDVLFSITHNNHSFEVPSPISGKVTHVNMEHIEHPEWIAAKPFELSWMVCIEPSNLSDELHSLKIGEGTIKWYKEEIDKYDELVNKITKENQETDLVIEGNNKEAEDNNDEKIWKEFSKSFFHN